METNLRMTDQWKFAILASEKDVFCADIYARSAGGAIFLINYWRHLPSNLGML
jgi:hypothetical protein